MAKLALLLIAVVLCASATQVAGSELINLQDKIRTLRTYTKLSEDLIRHDKGAKLKVCIDTDGRKFDIAQTLNSCGAGAATSAADGSRAVLIKFGNCGLQYQVEGIAAAFIVVLNCAMKSYAG